MKQRVFISGVAGFLGSHLAESFVDDGFEVIGCDNMIGGYLDNIPRSVEFHQIDCNDFNALKDVLRSVDIVYHCAATAYEGLSVFSPHLVTQNIVSASTGLITASIVNKVKRFVMCSSMARYGSNRVPFTEDMTPKPQDPYGIGKYASELLLKNLAEVHGMEWVIAVPHNIIGPRQKYDDPYRNVASIFINMILQGRMPYVYGDGTQKRCFSFISDDISPLKQMAFLDSCVGQIINIGPDDEFITINELAFTIARLIGKKIQINYVQGRPQEVHLANCSADKARKLLGYTPSVKLEDGLKEMITWISQRGVRPFNYHLALEIISERTPATWNKKLF